MEFFSVSNNTSRIGNEPIIIPTDVTVQLISSSLQVRKGSVMLNYMLPDYITCSFCDGKLFLSISDFIKSADFGLHRAHINNLIAGIDNLFLTKLKINGVGYKADIFSDYLILSLGFSHLIYYKVPSYVIIELVSSIEIKVCGLDKHMVNMIASDICGIKKYDPYKKKGIYKLDKYLFSKVMKKK